MKNKLLFCGKRDRCQIYATKKYKERKRTLDNKWQWCGVVVIQLKRGVFIKRKLVLTCIDFITECRIDKNWINNWKAPKETKNQINLVLKSLFKLLTQKNDNILAPRLWLSRPFEMKATSSWSGCSELI